MNCWTTRLLRELCERRTVAVVAAAAVLCVAAVAIGQQTTQPTTTAPAVMTPQEHYGLWVLVPPLVAIVLAVITRQVVAALFVATLVGAYMLLPCQGPEAQFADSNVLIRGLRLTVEGYIIGGVADKNHIRIMLFTLCIGGMVGVVGANGGTRSIVEVLSRWARTSRRGQVAGWIGGHAVFFDDYANSMILGPTLMPLYDRLRISRAKLAYIVDSTAAPVASLVPIGTWIGAEIGFIQGGLDKVQANAASQPVPEFLQGMNAYHAFLASIGYRFYAVFALVLVLLIALTRRDFGPMKRAERQAAEGIARDDHKHADDDTRGRAWYALVPVAAMVVITIVVLLVTGLNEFPENESLSLGTLRHLLVGADAYISILYGALAGLALAVLISVGTRTISTRIAMDAALDGMARMFPALVILILAWALSDATKALQLGEVVGHRLEAAQFAVAYLPLAVFGAACVVSFATGSSWGTMGILCPVAVEVAARLCGDLPADQALPLFYSTVGAVLAGAIFGDHCSPISDTTVLSSLASSCSLEEHVWTQIPYALVAAVVSVVAGHVLCNIYGRAWWEGLLCGVALLLVIVLAIGRRPAASTAIADAEG